MNRDKNVEMDNVNKDDWEDGYELEELHPS